MMIFPSYLSHHLKKTTPELGNSTDGQTEISKFLRNNFDFPSSHYCTVLNRPIIVSQIFSEVSLKPLQEQRGGEASYAKLQLVDTGTFKHVAGGTSEQVVLLLLLQEANVPAVGIKKSKSHITKIITTHKHNTQKKKDTDTRSNLVHITLYSPQYVHL